MKPTTKKTNIKSPSALKKPTGVLIPKGKLVDSRSKSFPIVAIGASSGGLEAVSELLKYLPIDTGMAFIVIQHLSPDYKSIVIQDH